jgi:hypothetical protein
MGEILETFSIGFIVMFTISGLLLFFRHQSDEDEPTPTLTPASKTSSTSSSTSSSTGGTGWAKFDKAPAQKIYHRHDVTWGAMNKPFHEYVNGDHILHIKTFASTLN